MDISTSYYELGGSPIHDFIEDCVHTDMITLENINRLREYAAQEGTIVVLVPTSDASPLENGFEKFLIEKDKKTLYAYINATLQKITGKIFHVKIVNRDRKEPFFAMRVFPSVSAIESICRKIISMEKPNLMDIYKAWSVIPEWELEIDEQIFNRYELNLNPKELTAILLHEVGHVVMSGEPVERFYRTFLECQAMANSSTRPLQKTLYYVYAMALSVACLQKSYLQRNDGIKIEMKADRYVLSKGYGEYLLSALDKIMRAYGCALTGGSPDVNRMDAELKENILWCNINVAHFIVRRTELAKQIHNRVSRRTNGYFKELGADIIKKVGNIPKDKFSNGREAFANESMVSLLEMDPLEFANSYEWVEHPEMSSITNSRLEGFTRMEAATEAFSKDIKKMLPSQYDIDCIAVEIDRIESQSDRKYVLNLIYANMDKIQRCREYIEKYPTYNGYNAQLDDMERQLNLFRKMVLDIHNLDREYKFFVKYPKGYEG